MWNSLEHFWSWGMEKNPKSNQWPQCQRQWNVLKSNDSTIQRSFFRLLGPGIELLFPLSDLRLKSFGFQNHKSSGLKSSFCFICQQVKSKNYVTNDNNDSQWRIFSDRPRTGDWDLQLVNWELHLSIQPVQARPDPILCFYISGQSPAFLSYLITPK